MSCKLYKLCRNTYEVTNCSQKERQCSLLKDYEKGVIPNKIIDRIDFSTDKEPMQCPRSLNTRIDISKNCIVKACPFNNDKVSYHCFLIHHQLFFPEFNLLPRQVMELCLQFPYKYMDRIAELSIYISRLYIIILKYRNDYMYENNLTKKVRSKKLKSYLSTKRYTDICGICETPDHDHQCKCIRNPTLRKNRIDFIRIWKNKIKKASSQIKINIDLPLRDFISSHTSEMYSKEFVLSLIGSLHVNNLYLTDIPFGYLYATYHNIFDDREYSRTSNLGMTEIATEIADKLFLKGKATNE